MFIQLRLHIRRDLRVAGTSAGFTFPGGRTSGKSACQDKNDGQCVWRFEFAHFGLLRTRLVVNCTRRPFANGSSISPPARAGQLEALSKPAKPSPPAPARKCRHDSKTAFAIECFITPPSGFSPVRSRVKLSGLRCRMVTDRSPA